MDELPKKREDIQERPLDEELVLYDPVDSVMHTMNAVAAAIWRLCDGRHVPKDIAREICSRYDADPQAVLKDVRQTIGHFREKKLLQD